MKKTRVPQHRYGQIDGPATVSKVRFTAEWWQREMEKRAKPLDPAQRELRDGIAQMRATFARKEAA